MEEKLQNLYKRRDRYTTGVFMLTLKTILVFAIPALVAVFLGKKLDSSMDLNRTFSIVFLAVAFFISWTYVIKKYKEVTKETKKIQREIESLREEIKNKEQ